LPQSKEDGEVKNNEEDKAIDMQENVGQSKEESETKNRVEGEANGNEEGEAKNKEDSEAKNKKDGEAKSILKLNASVRIKGGNDSSDMARPGDEKEGENAEEGEGEKEALNEEEKEEDETEKQVDIENEQEQSEEGNGQDDNGDEGEGKTEKEETDDIKKSLEKVDKKLFLITNLMNRKFNEILTKLESSKKSKEESFVVRQIDPRVVETAKRNASKNSTEESAKTR